MFKILFWLLFDAFFTYSFVSFYDELGGYIWLFLVIILWFTWELIYAIKEWIKGRA